MKIWGSICCRKKKFPNAQDFPDAADKGSSTYIQYKYPTLSSNGCNSLLKPEPYAWRNGARKNHNGISREDQSPQRNGTRELHGIRKKRTTDLKRVKKGRVYFGRAIVELTKYDDTGNFGITISATNKKKKKIRIISIKPGSPAHRSDVLDVGDCVISVNGHKIAKPKPAYVADLLKHSGNTVQLEIEYRLPDLYSKQQFLTRGTFFVKNVNVKLKRDDNSSFGFNVRGGLQPDRPLPWPLIITKVRNGGPADREGCIKPGDRLILIDNINITNATLTETLSLINHCAEEAIFTIEYDTIYYDKLQNSKPFLLEIEKPAGLSLGISMFVHRHGSKSYICISGIKPASIADRCGALKANDAILAIDDMSTNSMTVPEASRLLKYNAGKEDNVIRLEILKNFSTFCNSDLHIWSNAASGNSSKEDDHPYNNDRGAMIIEKSSSLGSEKTESSLGSLPCFKYSSKVPPMIRNHKKRMGNGKTCDSETSYSSLSTLLVPSYQVCHSETTEVLLEMGSHGLGLALQNTSARVPSFYTFISGIESESVAEKSGVIQVGDRILSVNGESAVSVPAQRVVEMITKSALSPNTDPALRLCTLKIEFDVAESIVATSGVFLIQIAKKGSPDLGLSLMAPKKRKLGEPLIISHVRKGSPAYRLGTIQPGDKFLAVDNISVLYHTLQEAVDILRTCSDLIKLKIQKDDTFSDEYDTLTNSVVYSVEVCKNGGPLGLTLSGSQQPFDNPIKISAISPGGIIDKTGAIHVDDKLLAINGESLRGKSLNEALAMLESGGDSVILKISKSRPLNTEIYGHYGESCQQYQSRLENYDKLFMENYTYQQREHHLNRCLPSVPSRHERGCNLLGTMHNYAHFQIPSILPAPSSTNPKRNGIVWTEYTRDNVPNGADSLNYDFVGDENDGRISKRHLDGSQNQDFIQEINADTTPVQSVDSAVESLDSSGGENHSPPIQGMEDLTSRQHSKYPSPPPLLLYDASAATSIIPTHLQAGPMLGFCNSIYSSIYCDHGRVRQNASVSDNSNLYHHCRRPKRTLVSRHSSPSCSLTRPNQNYSVIFKDRTNLGNVRLQGEALSDGAPCFEEEQLVSLNRTTDSGITKSPLPLKSRRFNSCRSSSPDPFYSRPYFPPKCQDIMTDVPKYMMTATQNSTAKKRFDNEQTRDFLRVTIPQNSLNQKLSQKGPKQEPVTSSKKTSRIMSDEWSDLLKNLDNFGESELLKHIEEAILGEGTPVERSESPLYPKHGKSSLSSQIKRVDSGKMSKIMTSNLNPWYLRNGPSMLGFKETKPDAKVGSSKLSANTFPILYKVHLTRELLGTKFAVEIAELPQRLGFVVASVREIAIVEKQDFCVTEMDLQSFRMLRPMDRILQINGLSTKSLSWERLVKQLDSMIKPTLELSLGRDNSSTNNAKNSTYETLQDATCRKYLLRNNRPTLNISFLPSTFTRKCIIRPKDNQSVNLNPALKNIESNLNFKTSSSQNLFVTKCQDGDDKETSTSTLNTVIYTTHKCDITILPKGSTTSITMAPNSTTASDLEATKANNDKTIFTTIKTL